MRTQFDVGQEVYVRAVVEGIEVDSHGVEYRVCIPHQNPIYSPKLTLREDSLTSCEVEDFRRENPTPSRIISDYMSAHSYAKVVVADKEEQLDIEALKGIMKGEQ